MLLSSSGINLMIFTMSGTLLRRFHTRNAFLSYVQVKNATRYNEINVRMLDSDLHEQIFRGRGEFQREDAKNVFKLVSEEFKKHNLEVGSKIESDEEKIPLKLPPLLGQNIDEHFRLLGERQCEPYRTNCDEFSGVDLPEKPDAWTFSPGWTMYENGGWRKVGAPLENIVVFDVEVLQTEGDGQYPTLACAVSPKAWYSWCSKSLTNAQKYSWRGRVSCSDMIPMETSPDQKRLIIGHNVSFDRSFIQEQYYLKKSETRFLDTMSLHIATSGFTGFQRMVYNAVKTTSTQGEGRKEINQLREQIDGNLEDQPWINSGSMNNLSDVHRLHCGGTGIDKHSRDVFTQGTMQDVRSQFQTLMEYCANDVVATHDIFCKLWPEFLRRLPNPVTLSGMLEIGSAYLPVNYNWQKYLTESESAYTEHQRELKLMLMRAANEACELVRNDVYRKDPWLWDLDWDIRQLRLNKPTKPRKKDLEAMNDKEELTEVDKMMATASRLPKVRQHMPGYPSWYRDLCPKLGSENWSPGPSLISTQMRVSSKLLRLTWEGYPVHYDENHGWGYLVPGKLDDKMNRELNADVDIDCEDFPVKSIYEYCTPKIRQVIKDMNMRKERNGPGTPVTLDALSADSVSMETSDMDADVIKSIWQLVGNHRQMNGNAIGKRNYVSRKKLDDGPFFHKGDGPYEPTDKRIRGCWFFRIPHKDGTKKNVGNPLSKTFLSKMEDKTLQGAKGEANRVLELSKMCSYWKNNRDRIRDQLVCWLTEEQMPESIVKADDYQEGAEYGAILPRLVSAGTVTRRAVEPTWLTASNAYPDRIGSELKAMIQPPAGHCFVGADVDSQELWIAAVLGDSHSYKIHGSTPFSWMCLQGKKSDGTDLHSKTAEYVNISRDHAKVLNYSRIYGAGQPFAERLLMQFNHQLSQTDARKKAVEMYKRTKGHRSNGLWTGGTESSMFNKLESVALSEAPSTPVLGCQICKPLEPKKVDKLFMTSRVNWVVQSSAVDFLHLMLTCMNWLFEEFDIDGRFCISIHDEVRYLVNSEDRYRAALALQITNLLTRSLFAYKLGMPDLPLSVAFFSAVDVDTCLRKEVTFNCVTPSNPLGLAQGYSIPIGEALAIEDILERTGGGKLDPL